MAKIIIIVLCAAIAIWGYNAFTSGDFSKFRDSATNVIKKEKTIDAVTAGRKQQQRDIDDVENRY